MADKPMTGLEALKAKRRAEVKQMQADRAAGKPVAERQTSMQALREARAAREAAKPAAPARAAGSAHMRVREARAGTAPTPPVKAPAAAAKPRGGPGRRMAADVSKGRVAAPAGKSTTAAKPAASRVTAKAAQKGVAKAKAALGPTVKDTKVHDMPPKPTRMQALKSKLKSDWKGRSADKSYRDYKSFVGD